MPKLIDLTGRKFGRLIVIKRTDNDKRGIPYWLCKCDCGKETVVVGSDLKRGRTKSCGCFKTKHGHNIKTKVSKTYTAWGNIIQRCTNPNNPSYHNYGGRGIKICKRWRKFINFLEDMGEAPKGRQIDRVNNNSNYCKSNCRWATKKEQMRNTRRSRLITYGGETQCLAVWAKQFHISENTLFYRLGRGWPVEKALMTPTTTT